MDVCEISIYELSGSADTAEQGNKLYDCLVAALNCAEEVRVSFAYIDVATPSFVNTSFVVLLDKMPLAEIKKRIRIIDSTRQINAIIKQRLDT